MKGEDVIMGLRPEQLNIECFRKFFVSKNDYSRDEIIRLLKSLTYDELKYMSITNEEDLYNVYTTLRNLIYSLVRNNKNTTTKIDPFTNVRTYYKTLSDIYVDGDIDSDYEEETGESFYHSEYIQKLGFYRLLDNRYARDVLEKHSTANEECNYSIYDSVDRLYERVQNTNPTTDLYKLEVRDNSVVKKLSQLNPNYLYTSKEALIRVGIMDILTKRSINYLSTDETDGLLALLLFTNPIILDTTNVNDKYSSGDSVYYSNTNYLELYGAFKIACIRNLKDSNGRYFKDCVLTQGTTLADSYNSDTRTEYLTTSNAFGEDLLNELLQDNLSYTDVDKNYTNVEPFEANYYYTNDYLRQYGYIKVLLERGYTENSIEQALAGASTTDEKVKILKELVEVSNDSDGSYLTIEQLSNAINYDANFFTTIQDYIKSQYTYIEALVKTMTKDLYTTPDNDFVIRESDDISLTGGGEANLISGYKNLPSLFTYYLEDNDNGLTGETYVTDYKFYNTLYSSEDDSNVIETHKVVKNNGTELSMGPKLHYGMLFPTNKNSENRLNYGTDNFNGLNGTVVKYNVKDKIAFGYADGKTPAVVSIYPSEDPEGNLGAYWYEPHFDENYFIVYNSGSATTSFKWELLFYNETTNLNYYSHQTFNKTGTGKTVITHNLGFIPKIISVIPCGDSTAKMVNVGSIYIDNVTSTSLVVCNTGSNNISYFDIFIPDVQMNVFKEYLSYTSLLESNKAGFFDETEVYPTNNQRLNYSGTFHANEFVASNSTISVRLPIAEEDSTSFVSSKYRNRIIEYSGDSIYTSGKNTIKGCKIYKNGLTTTNKTDLAGNYIQAKDSSGNYLLDSNNNPIYETEEVSNAYTIVGVCIGASSSDNQYDSGLVLYDHSKFGNNADTTTENSSSIFLDIAVYGITQLWIKGNFKTGDYIKPYKATSDSDTYKGYGIVSSEYDETVIGKVLNTSSLSAGIGNVLLFVK
jgi:hypothetical protein